MKEKNYSFLTFIRKTVPVFLMLVFVNVGWGQYDGTGNFNKITSLVELTDGYYVVVNEGDTFAMNNSTTQVSNCLGNSAITANGIINPSSNLVWRIETVGAERTIYNESADKYVSYTGSSNNVQLSSLASSNNQRWTFTYSSGKFSVKNKQLTTRSLQYNSGSPRFACYTGSQQDLLLYKLAPPANLVPTVSNVVITGLPNTTVDLVGSYNYADTENDVDASTYKWYTATDASGTDAVAIAGANAINYTLTASELGKYIRFGVTAAAATGASPGVETYSTWIGPVNVAGTPVLNAGLLADFNVTCINTTSDANSFTLMGNNLQSNVTVEALSGFTFSQTETGTYTTTLSISPISEAVDATIFVKFTPTESQSYDSSITISGGGATSVAVSVIASVINTPVSVTTGISDALTSNSATLNGSFTEGCSAVTAYGIEYSTISGFANGAGTTVASTNLNAGNFTVNLSGLQSNTTYYYKAYATDGTGTLNGSQSSFVTTAIEDPTATAATLVTQTGFTANWSAVAGASGYELDVSTSATFLTVTSNTVTEGFETGLSGSTYETKDVTLSSGVWSVVNTRAGNTGVNEGLFSAQLQSTTGSKITSPVFTNGISTVSFWVTPSTTSGAIQVNYSIDNGVNWLAVENSPFTNLATSKSQKTISINTTVPTLFQIVRTGATIYLDDIIINSSTSTPSFVSGYNAKEIVGGSTTSSAVTDLIPNTEYFYRVRAKDANSTSVNSNVIEVTTSNFFGTTTFSAGAWDNGIPTVNLDAIIADNFTASTSFTAKSLTINAGSVFTVDSGSTVTVANALVNNAGVSGLVIKNNGVFLQTGTAANTALATVERNSSPLFRMDYTLWSSPVTGQNLRAFSPATLFNRFYSYNTDTNVYVQEIVTTEDASTINFGTGGGYLIRMPNTWVANTGGASALPYEGAFKGTLNNGTVTKPLSLLGSKYNLVGNPYPSPISIATLISVNTSQIEGSLYMWRKKGSAALPAGSGYVAYNALGQNQIIGDAQNGSTIPSTLTHIQAGQGFFVTAKAGAAAVTFNNSMRESAATEFFKTTVPVEMNRLWLTLSDATAPVGHVLVGYTTDATQGVDSNFDAPYFNDSPLALTSIINNNEYSIQGRALPFVATDVVPLGFKTDVAGSYSIALTNYDGVFDNDQDVFLKDNATNQLHNLKTAAYTFNSVAGVFNQRFELRYQGNLDTNNPSVASSSILIAVKNQQIKINAGSVTMEKVELIDVAGRVIYTVDGINATTATIENLVASNQILIVRISTKENGVVNQKIIF